MHNFEPRAIGAPDAEPSFRETISATFAKMTAKRSALEQALIELRASVSTSGHAAHFLNQRTQYIVLCRDLDWLEWLLQMSDGDAVMTADKPTPEEWVKSFVDRPHK
jgi:hypothetical protein